MNVLDPLSCLHLVHGLPLWRGSHAADMLTLQFGGRNASTTWKGLPCEIGDYALHIQCPWKLTMPSWELRVPIDEVELGKALRHFTSTYLPALVEAITADEKGGIRLVLAGGGLVEAFPDRNAEEQWRFFEPGRDRPHAIMTGRVRRLR